MSTLAVDVKECTVKCIQNGHVFVTFFDYNKQRDGYIYVHKLKIMPKVGDIINLAIEEFSRYSRGYKMMLPKGVKPKVAPIRPITIYKQPEKPKARISAVNFEVVECNDLSDCVTNSWTLKEEKKHKVIAPQFKLREISKKEILHFHNGRKIELKEWVHNDLITMLPTDRLCFLTGDPSEFWRQCKNFKVENVGLYQYAMQRDLYRYLTSECGLCNIIREAPWWRPGAIIPNHYLDNKYELESLSSQFAFSKKMFAKIKSFYRKDYLLIGEIKVEYTAYIVEKKQTSTFNRRLGIQVKL